MRNRARGSLIIIGGHEDKSGERIILTEVSRRARGGRKLVIVTSATQLPGEVADEYTRVFGELGVTNVEVLDVRTRRDACDEANVQKMDGAAVVFFTGGDQLRITSQMGRSPVLDCLHDLHENRGATIAGTSAGAAAMPETMIISGPDRKSNEISGMGMAPGLGLVRGVVIDSHFAERGRFGRLFGAVAHNPANLGLGIDEDTAVLAEGGDTFRVIGSGAVYVADGEGITYSSLSEESPEGTLSIFGIRLHVLGHGTSFDLANRRPVPPEEAGEAAA
jgi:cyanophycinase